MKNLSILSVATGASRGLSPLAARRSDHEPVVFSTLKYLHVPSQASLGEPLQAARGDDDLMSMQPGQV
ncbi:hypothetical protein [Chromohalobacter canadensis]|uniref:hypothetical protein n=1 Tax=Chromohalobacter canadensis TaxID=141389 RepID=UPI0024105AB9|nr:hypothetical protein [Chromohalobacter canadensis]